MPERMPRAVARERAVIYLRQSEFREESISLDSQEHICREFAERQGYDVVDVFADGVSGRTWQRPGVHNAMSAVEEGRAEVIVLWRWSRLSRNRRDWAVAGDRADVAGARIESATEPNDKTAAGRFGRGVMVELAAFESERIGEQWTEVHEHRVRAGLPPTGGPRFGYVRDEAGNYLPDGDAADMLADLYRSYLGGMGWHQLTRRLNERGFTVRGVNPWTYQGVMNVLDSGFGAGLLGRTRPKKLPPWEREYRPGAHPAVIDAATWEAYVAARAQRYRKPVRGGDDYVLTGIARCVDCGSPMSGKRFDGRATYVCSRAQTTTGVRRITMVAWRVEKAVEEWLFALSNDVAERERLRERTVTQTRRRQVSADSIRTQIEKADDTLAALIVKFAEGVFTDERAYKIAEEKVKADRVALEARLRMLADNPVQRDTAATLPHDLADLWPRMNKAAKRKVILGAIDSVEISPAEHRGQVDGRITIVPRWTD